MKNLTAKQTNFNFINQELVVTQLVKKPIGSSPGPKKIYLRWTVPLRSSFKSK